MTGHGRDLPIGRWWHPIPEVRPGLTPSGRLALLTAVAEGGGSGQSRSYVA